MRLNMNFFLISAIFVGISFTIFGFFAGLDGIDDLYWRPTANYLGLFLLFLSIAIVFCFFMGERQGLIALTLISFFLSGVAFEVLSIVFILVAGYLLGRTLFKRLQSVRYFEILTLSGVVVCGSVFSLTAHFPINSPSIWSIIYLCIFLICGRDLISKIDFWTDQPKFSLTSVVLLRLSIWSLAMIYFFLTCMPDIGHDALVTHHYIPAYVKFHLNWHFDPSIYTWSVGPMLANWIFTIGYFFSGELGSRLLNTSSLFLIAALLFRISEFVGVSKTGSILSALMFLSLPLTFFEASSLFTDGLWVALILAATYLIIEMTFVSESREDLRFPFAICLGGAVATKAITLALLPGLFMLVLYRGFSFCNMKTIKIFFVPALASISLGLIPYLVSYYKTGNPVFPFFNEVFRSELFPIYNFSDPLFPGGQIRDFFYSVSFQSYEFISGSVGAGGFHWLLFVCPAILIAFRNDNIKLASVFILLIIWLLTLIEFSNYLRYLLPAFAVSCICCGALYSFLESRSGVLFPNLLVVGVMALHLVHFNAATWYGKIDFGVIVDEKRREDYISKFMPMRQIVEILNKNNTMGLPVAFFSDPFAAGLHSHAFHPNWYNQKFFEQANQAVTAQSLTNVLVGRDIDYFVLGPSWTRTLHGAFLKGIGDEIFEINGNRLFRVKQDLKFKNELLLSKTFDIGWNLGEGVQLEKGNLVFSRSGSVSSGVYVTENKRYLLEISGRTQELAFGQVGLQVNWHDKNGDYLLTSSSGFTIDSETKKFSLPVTAPPGSTSAILYLNNDKDAKIEIFNASFRE